jgi:hypothetical protein
LYPFVNFPSWDDLTPLENGMWGQTPNANGTRPVYQPLADELKAQSETFRVLFEGDEAKRTYGLSKEI